MMSSKFLPSPRSGEEGWGIGRPSSPRGQLKCDVHARSHENPRLRMPCRVLGQNRVAFDAHVAIFKVIKARDGSCRCPHALAPGSGWQALLEGPEGGQVNGSWSPSSSSQNRLRWRHSARSSMRMRRCHASANRGTSLALRHARIHGRTIASCFGKSMIAARPSHLQPPHFAAFDKTRADWS